MRVILHVDVDAFYSAIEQRDRPELRGKPVVVGGDPDGRGVVATASYEARRSGIHSAMPCRAARRLCPEAVFVRPRFDVYRDVSGQIHQIFSGLTAVVEPIALDEAFLDVTARVVEWKEVHRAAGELKAAIREATELTASVGAATNKLVAKVASDFDKPDGLTIVPPGEEAAFLAPLSVRRLWGIGPRTEERLKAAGLQTVDDLARAEPAWVAARFGQAGLEWQQLAHGVDQRPVSARTEPRQLSRERTFSADITDRIEAREALEGLSQELVPAVEANPPARTLTIKLRYADFSTVTRRYTPGRIVTPELLLPLSLQLLEESWDGRPLRLLGIGVSSFILPEPEQLTLFG